MKRSGSILRSNVKVRHAGTFPEAICGVSGSLFFVNYDVLDVECLLREQLVSACAIAGCAGVLLSRH